MSEASFALQKTASDAVPRHVAIVMDGNHRWAKAKRLPGAAGHRAGAKNVRVVAEAAADLGVEVLTLFAFSTENWQRPKREVNLLMDLMRNMLENEVHELSQKEVQLRILGDRSRFPADLRMLMSRAEQLTREHDRLMLCIGANYGGRWDIVQAAVRIAGAVREGTVDSRDIDETTFARFMSLGDLPPPDLFIRTGGEQRISNFLLWDIAYTELYFTDSYWPDFDAEDLKEAFDAFARRNRSYGRRDQKTKAR